MELFNYELKEKDVINIIVNSRNWQNRQYQRYFSACITVTYRRRELVDTVQLYIKPQQLKYCNSRFDVLDLLGLPRKHSFVYIVVNTDVKTKKDLEFLYNYADIKI